MDRLTTLHLIPDKTWCFLGVHQHRSSCIIGIYPEERIASQDLFFNVKIKVDVSQCLRSGRLQDSVNYVEIAHLCNELAQNGYFLLECLASDILEECFLRFGAIWAWVSIQKPAAISTASYAFVEMERGNGRKD